METVIYTSIHILQSLIMFTNAVVHTVMSVATFDRASACDIVICVTFCF